MPVRSREFIDCIRCDGTGRRVECYDDLCHAQDRCMHGNNCCVLCAGLGQISTELADRWRQREPFEGVELPEKDRHVRRGDAVIAPGGRLDG